MAMPAASIADALWSRRRPSRLREDSARTFRVQREIHYSRGRHAIFRAQFTPTWPPREDTLMSLSKLAVGLTLSAALSFAGYAQAPPPPPKPDSPAVAAMVEKAKKTAGTQWADEEHF